MTLYDITYIADGEERIFTNVVAHDNADDPEDLGDVLERQGLL